MIEVLAIAVGYLAGSVPFGLLITKLGGAGDVRSIGSGNIGATNVLRTGRKGLAFLTLLFDALKGFVPVFIFAQYSIEAMALAGFAAFLGHCYPVWLKFTGGKGIATFVGIALAFSPILLAVFAVFWLCIAFVTRYSSLAALCATLATCIAAWLITPLPVFVACCLMTALTFWRHRENIARLRKGTEGRIGQTG